MKDAGQAMLWDGNRGEYVVVRVGERFHDFAVTSIDGDQVVLTLRGSADGSIQHFVLPRTSDTSDISGTSGVRPRAAAPGSAAPVPGLPAPAASAGTPGLPALIDPYPRPVVVSMAQLDVLDPYGTRGQISSVTAPPALRASAPPRAMEPAPGPAVPAAQNAEPSQPAGKPATRVAAVPQPVVPSQSHKPAVREESYDVSRREFDAAVTDFAALSKEVRLELSGEGVRINDLSRGSWFDRWGLRPGDVVMSIDGHALQGVDDAAAIYARLLVARAFVAKVKRGPDTVTLRYRFTK